jgi:molybdenum transport protein
MKTTATFERCELSDAQLQALLAEDAPWGDLTTRSLALGGEPGRARFSARAAMIVAGAEEAARLFDLCGSRARIARPSGSPVEAGAILLEAEGPADSLLLAWKVAQALVEACSGVATATGRIVAALRNAGHATPVACTRKNFPGTRALASKSVRAGGGVMHRLGLSESLLVFPEHRAFIAADALPAKLAAVKAAQPEKKLVVEVGSVDEALAIARAGADVLQLERFSPQALQALRVQLAQRGLRPLLAPAGGITADNAVAYAEAGADLLVTSAPYFAGPADVKVMIAAAAD